MKGTWKEAPKQISRVRSIKKERIIRYTEDHVVSLSFSLSMAKYMKHHGRIFLSFFFLSMRYVDERCLLSIRVKTAVSGSATELLYI